MRASLLNYTVEAKIFVGNFISLISLLLQIHDEFSTQVFMITDRLQYDEIKFQFLWFNEKMCFYSINKACTLAYTVVLS